MGEFVYGVYKGCFDWGRAGAVLVLRGEEWVGRGGCAEDVRGQEVQGEGEVWRGKDGEGFGEDGGDGVVAEEVGVELVSVRIG